MKFKRRDYFVSDVGEVKANHKNGWVNKKLTPDSKGYLCTRINGVLHKVHRLVAEKYLPNPEGLPQVNHKDGNKKNNKATNLEWVSNIDNSYHAMGIGLHSNPSLPVIGVNKTGEGIFLRSVSEGDKFGIHHPNISKCLRGSRKTAGGYTWEIWRGSF